MIQSVLQKKLNEELIKRNQPILNIFDEKKRFTLLNAGYEKNILHINKAYRCFIEDCSGNVYIDTALGAGTHILGHANPILTEEIIRQSKEGTLYILPNKYAYEAGKLLSEIIPHFHSFVFCNSGSEATMRAARLARAYTEKKKIAMFGGGWHGGNDLMLYEDDYDSDEKRPLAMFKSGGLPKDLLDLVLFLPYNSDDALDLIEQHKDELAMVIIEPSQGSNPRDDVGDFLHQLREITSKCDILLCFDEIITGFRVALGGCQEYYGVEADIVTYGKTLGGGLPVGMVSGNEEVMNAMYGNDQRNAVFMGGTFSANPLVMCLTKCILEYLKKNEDTVYPYLNQNGKYIRDTVNEFCLTNDVPVRMIGIGSMSRMIFTGRPITSRRERDKYEIGDAIQKLFYLYLLLEKGVHISSNGVIFISTEHYEEHIEEIIQCLTHSLEYFSKELNLI
jgi:glutamate-1-semialdehyde 2,1-aminomutase